MKILHTSDWHLGKSLYDFSLLSDQRQMIDFILELITREQIDLVILAGDIYDRPVPSAEAVRLYDFFLTSAVAEAGVPVIAIAGNHDSASRIEFGSRLYAGGGYHVFGTARPDPEPLVLRDNFGDVNFFPVPWLHPAEIRAMFNDETIKTFDDAYRVIFSGIQIDPAARNVAIAHGFFAGISEHSEKDILTSDSEINIGGMDIADSSLFSVFDYTALGHLHAPQQAGALQIRFSGSPLKYSLSEENQKKSCTIVELFEKNNTQIRSVPIPAVRDVRSVTGKFEELLEPSFHENKNFNDYVFANITDSGILYPMEKLRTLFPNLLGLRFLSNIEESRLAGLPFQNAQRLSVIELFRRFYKDTYSTEIPQESLDFLLDVIAKSEVSFE